MARSRRAVSGPAELSERTDLGAAQPIRVPAGLPFGERQALEASQSAVPLPEAQGPAGPPAASQAAAAGGLPADPAAALFAPTARPGESNLAGLGQGNDFIADDPDLLLKAIYTVYPHPDILRLLRDAAVR